jgi:WD40 repeat protein
MLSSCALALTPLQVLPLELEHIVGLSEPSANVACISPGKLEGVLAYAAGSFVVLYDWKKRKQLQTFRSKTSNQPITCICWSASGRYLACGETGSPAAAYIWDTTEGTCVQELRGHKKSIAALCFSPDGASIT